MPGYALGVARNDSQSIKSLKTCLLHNLVSESKWEILPFERLFIIEKCDLSDQIPQRHLVNLYMDCGCFDKAEEIFKEIRHYRKLGDLAWMQRNLPQAYEYYSYPEDSNGAVFRRGPDLDRLIKLAFFEGKWQLVIELIYKSDIMPGMDEGQIILSGSQTGMKPYLDMLAISLSKLEQNEKNFPYKLINKFFRISQEDWSNIFHTTANKSDAEIQKSQQICLPRFTKVPYNTFENALSRGNTSRANDILDFLNNAHILLTQAKDFVKSYLKSGDEQQLLSFFKIINQSGISSISQTCLLESMPYIEDENNHIPLERLARLYGGHPVMNKRYFGKLLDVKFKGEIPVSGSELLTAMFQRLASVDLVIQRITLDKRLNIDKLFASSDWAEMRLDEWAKGEGLKMIVDVRNIWKEGKASLVKGPFNPIKAYPESPRNMKEWLEVIDYCHKWLADHWENEIGISPWKSENRLFELVKKAFKDKEVLRNHRPLWLIPQHLDIFIPELSLAIEYMGLQHYEPVDIFGGEEGFKRCFERDKRKAEICSRANINLFYIRHDEEISERVAQISELFLK
jgi:hypothetical protein